MIITATINSLHLISRDHKCHINVVLSAAVLNYILQRMRYLELDESDARNRRPVIMTMIRMTMTMTTTNNINDNKFYSKGERLLFQKVHLHLHKTPYRALSWGRGVQSITSHTVSLI
jgi:hypothetical protein